MIVKKCIEKFCSLHMKLKNKDSKNIVKNDSKVMYRKIMLSTYEIKK